VSSANTAAGGAGMCVSRRTTSASCIGFSLPWAARSVRGSPSPGEGLDPPVASHHQDLGEVGRHGQLGVDEPIGLDIGKPAVADRHEPSIATNAGQPSTFGPCSRYPFLALAGIVGADRLYDHLDGQE